MRALLLALVVANLIFLAWAQGWLAPGLPGPRAGLGEPQRLANQVRPEWVRVVPAPRGSGSGGGGGSGGGNDNGGGSQTARPAMYPLDVLVEASDRQGLLRDIGEVFSKERMNVTGIHTQNARQRGTAWMTITAETTDTARLSTVLTQLSRIAGVRQARRK